MATSASETAVPGRVPTLLTRYWLLVPLVVGALLLIVAEFLPLYEIRTITAVPEGGRTYDQAEARPRVGIFIETLNATLALLGSVGTLAFRPGR